MFRKKRDLSKPEPMPKKQFMRICKAFRRQGGIICMGPEIDVLLENRGAEAITYDASTILFHTNPSRAAVYEELIHTYQFKTGQNDCTPKRRVICEIEAQKKLLKYSKEYCLTDIEIQQTKMVLLLYENELKKLERGDV